MASKIEWVEIIEPRTGSTRRTPIVYIHGGGWVAGRTTIHDVRAQNILAVARHRLPLVEQLVHEEECKASLGNDGDVFEGSLSPIEIIVEIDHEGPRALPAAA